MNTPQSPGPVAAMLTHSDVEQLLSEPSPATRGRIVRKIGGQFDSPDLSEREREIAVAIFRHLLGDVEVQVRQTMSETLKNSALLPHDVARALARDVAEVALPILEFSEILTNQDLIEIVRDPIGVKVTPIAGEPGLLMIDQTGTPDNGDAKHIAIARRQTVPQPVAEALVDNAQSEAIATLMRNPGADISALVADRAIERFGTDENVQIAMIDRSEMPIGVMGRMVDLVSGALRKRLVAKHGLSASLSGQLAILAGERTKIDLLQQSRDAQTAPKLAAQLKRTDKLTPTIMLRALCVGEAEFFKYALAAISGLSISDVRNVFEGRHEAQVRAMVAATRLPGEWIGTFEAAIAAYLDLGWNVALHQGADAHARLMIDGTLARLDHDVSDIERELDAFLAHLPPRQS